MSPRFKLSRMRGGLGGLAGALMILCGSGSPTLAEGELDESVKINGEVALYLESTTTNFNADYNEDLRGQKAWKQYFGDGAKDTYSFTETRFKEAELKFDKATRINEDWVMVNHVEIELKPISTYRNKNDYDVEEASAKFQHSSGTYVHMGILQDAHVHTPGLILDMSAGDDKGFDENPALRVGYKTGPFDVNARYSSLFVEKSYSYTDSNGEKQTAAKIVGQTFLHGEVAYKQKGALQALVYYTTFTSANKKEGGFQKTKAALPTADDVKGYKAAGLESDDVFAASLALEFGPFVPYANLEQWHVELDDGASKYDTQVLTVGLNAQDVGPGNLIIATEQGTSDISGKDVKFTGYGAEYLFKFNQTPYGPSVHGPGFKTFSNDAPEKLRGTVYYYASKWMW